MVSVRRALRTLGASADTLSLVAHAHRSSTQSVYQTYWAGWVAWCTARDISPVKPSVFQLANFLSGLSVSQNLALSTIKGYRSAIVTTIKQLGGRVRDQSRFPDLLRDVVRGVSLSVSRQPRRVPAWDLFRVLASLRLSPYEPLSAASLLHLTFKAAFLILLATGRRVSEVHSLSGLASDVSLNRMVQ